MPIFIDCEGEPVQEFSAIYVNECGDQILDVFHQHVKYPFACDYDFFSRRHIHGLKLVFLERYGLCNETSLLTLFHKWLENHPNEAIYGHSPGKEEKLLSLPIFDVSLKPWKDRINCHSHQLALSMKLNSVPVCNVSCAAHKRVRWKVKNVLVTSATDVAKFDFFHHCSLYDCVECYLSFFSSN